MNSIVEMLIENARRNAHNVSLQLVYIVVRGEISRCFSSKFEQSSENFTHGLKFVLMLT